MERPVQMSLTRSGYLSSSSDALLGSFKALKTEIECVSICNLSLSPRPAQWSVAAPSVHRPWPGVVPLELCALHHPALRVPLHHAPVDTCPHRVGVWVKTLPGLAQLK